MDTGGGGGRNTHPGTDGASNGNGGSAPDLRNAGGDRDIDTSGRRHRHTNSSSAFANCGGAYYRRAAYADLDTNAGRRYCACAKDTGRRSTRYRRV